jgi:hypothetical protein
MPWIFQYLLSLLMPACQSAHPSRQSNLDLQWCLEASYGFAQEAEAGVLMSVYWL